MRPGTESWKLAQGLEWGGDWYAGRCKRGEGKGCVGDVDRAWRKQGPNAGLEDWGRAKTC